MWKRDWGSAIPFLEIFVSNFRYWVFAVWRINLLTNTKKRSRALGMWGQGPAQYKQIILNIFLNAGVPGLEVILCLFDTMIRRRKSASLYQIRLFPGPYIFLTLCSSFINQSIIYYYHTFASKRVFLIFFNCSTILSISLTVIHE